MYLTRISARPPFAPDISFQTSFVDFLSEDSYLRFPLALLYSASYVFSLYCLPSPSLCTAFDSISSNIDEVFSINLSANVFVFGDFNVHHKHWLTYSGGIDRPGFSVSNDLTQMINFPTWIPNSDSHASICSIMVPPYWES